MNTTDEVLIKWRRQILAILSSVEEEMKQRHLLDITTKELRENHKLTRRQSA